MSETMTVNEAQAALGYSQVITVYRLLWSRKLAGEKVAGVWRVSRAAVEERAVRVAQRRTAKV